MRFALAAAVVATALALGACGGGKGGNDVEPPAPPPGGVGTGADGVTIFWYPYDTNAAFGEASSIQETSDGGLVVAGFQMTDLGARQDLLVMKVDVEGVRQWQLRTALGTNAWGHGVRRTADGGYVVVGTVGVAPGDTDAFLLRLDGSGKVAPGWPRTYGGDWADEGLAVLPVGGGAQGFLVTGRYAVAAGSPRTWLLRTDAGGAVEWERSDYASFCPGGGEQAQAIVALDGGDVAVAGQTGCFGWAGFLMRIDGTDGGEVWRHAYSAASGSVRLAALAPAPAGGFVLAGSIAPASGARDALVVRASGDGEELWRRTYGGGEDDELRAVAATADGGWLMAGVTRSYGGAVDPGLAYQWEDLYLVRLDAGGETLWRKVKGNRPPAGDLAAAVAPTADGGFGVGGGSDGAVLLARLDKNGDTVNLGATDFSYTVPGTSGLVDPSNAVEVAAAAVSGLLGPREVGGSALDLLVAAALGDPASDFCTGGGSYAFLPAPPPEPVPGSVFALTFTGCVTGPSDDLSQIDGTGTVAVDSLTGTFGSGSYGVQTTLTAIDLAISEAGDAEPSSRTTGGMRHAREAEGAARSEGSSSIASPSAVTLLFEETPPDRTVVVGPFDVSSAVLPGGAVRVGAAGDTATVEHEGLVLSVVVDAPLESAAVGAPPASGGLRATATDGSSVTVTVAGGTALLDVDTDADGTADATLSVAWDVLDP
jgi:hypothetical protein